MTFQMNEQKRSSLTKRIIQSATAVLLCATFVGLPLYWSWHELFPSKPSINLSQYASNDVHVRPDDTLNVVSPKDRRQAAVEKILSGLTHDATSPLKTNLPSTPASKNSKMRPAAIQLSPPTRLKVIQPIAGDAGASQVASIKLAGRTFGSVNDSLAAALHPSLKYAKAAMIGRMAEGLSVADVSANVSGSNSASTREMDAKNSAQSDEHRRLIETNIALENERRFVTSMCMDLEGRLWVGSEEESGGNGGIQCFDPALPALHQWKKYTTSDGLGDDNGYALACDKRGRIWIGHLNHGVSVYNNNLNGRWQSYELLPGLSRPESLAGPLGERVFSIAVCPIDGDVWIGTNRGLARYSDRQDHWSFYGRANGLPPSSIRSIAFDRNGRFYGGTECDGVVVAQAADDYRQFRQVGIGADVARAELARGLPSRCVNAVYVSKADVVYVGTPEGMAWSSDQGESWRSAHGRDYLAKLAGRYAPIPPPPAQTGEGLGEDYVTAIAQGTRDNSLWVGHQRTAAEEIEISDDRIHVIKREQLGIFATCLLGAGAQGATFSGGYGSGVLAVGSIPAQPDSASHGEPTRLPAAATIEDIQRSLAEAAGRSTQTDARSPVVALDDDWRTQGDWIGRYGKYWACLCSMAGYDYLWGAGETPIHYSQRIGPHRHSDDSIRFWIQWLYTANPKALELPPVYFDSRLKKGLTDAIRYRRQSENDDHGEVYPYTWEGPDLYYDISIPEGTYVLSLYDYNKDAQSLVPIEGDTASGESTRDYEVSLSGHLTGKSLQDGSGSGQDSSELAHCRIHSFFGGVYKRFKVQGPIELTVKISKGSSKNTILDAIFIDTLSPRPEPYFDGVNLDSVSDTNEPDHLSAVERVRRLSTFKRDSVTTVDPTEAENDLLNFQLFSALENVQRKQGFSVPRDIEKSLKWDQFIPAYSGRGRETVLKYQAYHKPTTRPNTIVQPDSELNVGAD